MNVLRNLDNSQSKSYLVYFYIPIVEFFIYILDTYPKNDLYLGLRSK